MDSEEQQFDNGFCSWDMVTGKSGTYFRTWDPYFKLSGIDVPIEELVESWYYDDASPIGTGDKGAPMFQNGWTMCSGLVNVGIFCHCTLEIFVDNVVDTFADTFVGTVVDIFVDCLIF